jgi:hypothetical protein
MNTKRLTLYPIVATLPFIHPKGHGRASDSVGARRTLPHECRGMIQ